MTTHKKYRIGTRGSPLALAQAYETRDRLVKAFPDRLKEDDLEIVVIKTTGDQIQDRPLSEAGGKGLFVKEIEQALIDGDIDFAVHSMKDMETTLPDGLVIDCILPREDARDAFISASGKSLEELPAGSMVGTASLRRQAQILNKRPDLKVCIFRGAVATRLRKLEEGEADATLLAMAGLRRLGKEDVVTQSLEKNEMLPAVAQGAIGIERRADDADVGELLAAINHVESRTRVTAERAMLAELDGSCRTPIAGHAILQEDGSLYLEASLLSPDGKDRFDVSGTAAPEDAEKLGQKLGAELRDLAGPDFAAFQI
ncbi:hydroxymethylbilane synthase [Sneathiella sp. P13V-1]|uniref:hydroxymethylbilane synthase n=1 Tax=Sneathiella sp. P13V-1 TaxID=2697366 RepID=UPI00187BBC2E|nr:hydroxymethylbilane synthase [Sneathiella sp. P13V-1]MBE7636247.1 hydroxymethylbilane synthase [Sneathiella sp. P13V-1]